MTLDSEAGESAEGSRVISFIETVFVISLYYAGKVPATDRSLLFLNYMFCRCALTGRFFAAHISAELRKGKAGVRLPLSLLVQYTVFTSPGRNGGRPQASPRR